MRCSRETGAPVYQSVLTPMHERSPAHAHGTLKGLEKLTCHASQAHPEKVGEQHWPRVRPCKRRQISQRPVPLTSSGVMRRKISSSWSRGTWSNAMEPRPADSSEGRSSCFSRTERSPAFESVVLFFESVGAMAPTFELPQAG